MKRRSRHNAVRLLRWVFRRGNRFLTCQLERIADTSAYRVAIVPHWDCARALVRSYDAGVTAFRDHAELAAELREAGWTLTAYSRPVR